MSNPTVNPYQPQPNKALRRFFSWIRSSCIVRGDDRWIGGVCSGIAARLGWSPTLVRALMIVSTLVFGFGAALYAFGWFLLPDVRNGRILGEDLVNGRWNWNCLGCFLFMAVALVIPGAGWVCIGLAAVVLWALVTSGIRQREGYGFGYHGGRPGPSAAPSSGPYTAPNGGLYPGPGASGAPYGGPYNGPYSPPFVQPSNGSHMGPAGQHPYVPGYAGANGAGRGAGQAPFNPVNPVNPAMTPAAPASPMGPTNQHPPFYGAPGAGDSYAGPMPASGSYAVPSPVPDGQPHSQRRKPAGPILVLAVLGLMLISIAAIMAIINANDFGLAPIVELVTVWSAAVCIVMGIIVVILGVRGRRAGGLIPLGLIAGACAVAMIIVSGTFSAYYYDITHNDGTYASTVTLSASENSENGYGMNEIQVGDTMVADSSTRTLDVLKQGVSFVGDSYENSKAILDLSAWPDMHSPHEIELMDGRKSTSNCPVGDITIAAYQAQVHIILPSGCSYGFGSTGYGYVLSDSVGGKYEAASVDSARWPATVFGFGGLLGNGFSEAGFSDMTGDDYVWMNDYDSMPSNGPELLIRVPYALEGRVNVVYVSDWEDLTFRQFDNLHGTESGRRERQDYINSTLPDESASDDDSASGGLTSSDSKESKESKESSDSDGSQPSESSDQRQQEAKQ